MAASTTKADTTRVTCKTCSMTFLTQAELEKHNKLEHVEHKIPAGVS
ncbi:MAG: hypothetical protein ABI361_02010 [Nitrososphaera sp.]